MSPPLTVKIFLVSGYSNKRDIFILFKEIHQHLENPCNSVNQYFPHGQGMMAPNCAGTGPIQGVKQTNGS